MAYSSNVFINCPFDDLYMPLFNAIIFTISDCGFIPRCTQEEDNAGQVRLDKIYKIIADCKYAVHDISRTELDVGTNLPRFNMPLELGVWLGSMRYSSDRKFNQKKCLILDRERYRYQQYLSDIAGQDIREHNDDFVMVIRQVRNWLRTNSKRVTLPGAGQIAARYNRFQADLPTICNNLQLNPADLIFIDYVHVIEEWLKLKTP